MTGFTIYEYSMSGKWLELLKEIAPAATRGVVAGPGGRLRDRAVRRRTDRAVARGSGEPGDPTGATARSNAPSRRSRAPQMAGRPDGKRNGDRSS